MSETEKGRVVLAAALPRGRVVGHHRVHATGGDAPVESRLPKCFEGVEVVHVGLRKYCYAKTVLRQDLSDDGRAGVGGVDIGVARDENDVCLVPAKPAHLVSGGGKKHVRRLYHLPSVREYVCGTISPL